MLNNKNLRYLCFTLFIALFAGCGKGKVKPEINVHLNGEKIPVQESWNSKIVFSDLNKTKAILYSTHLSVFDKERETLLENLRIDFFDDEGTKTSTLTSKRGKVDDITKDMFAIDSVVAVSDSGVTLLTDYLKWENKTQLISSDRFVKIITPNEVIEGYGLQSDQHLQNYQILEPTYQSKEKK